jgi:DNA-binding LacI/PurR family transcriptional regulator
MKKNPIVFVSSALLTGKAHTSLAKDGVMDGLDFFSVLASQLSIQLQDSNIDLIIKVPKPVDVAIEQRKILTQIYNRNRKRWKKYYSGIIIAPFSTDYLKNYLCDLMQSRPMFPVLTIDKSFENHFSFFNSSEVYCPPSVTCNGEDGGRIAGQRLKEFLSIKTVESPYIGIIKGLEASKERIKGFVDGLCGGNDEKIFTEDGTEEIKYKKDEYTIVISREIPYQRFPAFEQTSLLLENHKNTEGIPLFNAFFCCNDEMALGVRDALIKKEADLKFNNICETLDIKIIGFDGIRDVTYLIDQEDKWILGTIDVELPSQVDKIVELCETFLNSPHDFIKEHINNRNNHFHKQSCKFRGKFS